MTPFTPYPMECQRRRIPVGYRLQTMPDGTYEVVLETQSEILGTPLGPSYRQVISDYKNARRSIRAYNRSIRGRVPGTNGHGAGAP